MERARARRAGRIREPRPAEGRTVSRSRLKGVTRFENTEKHGDHGDFLRVLRYGGICAVTF
jgi:hypothetical protein